MSRRLATSAITALRSEDDFVSLAETEDSRPAFASLEPGDLWSGHQAGYVGGLPAATASADQHATQERLRWSSAVLARFSPHIVLDPSALVSSNLHYVIVPSTEEYFEIPSDMVIAGWDVTNRLASTPPQEVLRTILIESDATAFDYNRLVSVGSTQTEDSSVLLEKQLVGYFNQLVREAADEVFSDGMESVFSRRLASCVEAYGDPAVHVVDDLLGSGRTDVEVVGEILRQMGSMEDARTRRSRFRILVKHLRSTDVRIRDAASLGLASLDDPEAAGPIQQALEQETSPQLRVNLALVLDQLQPTRWQSS